MAEQAFHVLLLGLNFCSANTYSAPPMCQHCSSYCDPAVYTTERSCRHVFVGKHHGNPTNTIKGAEGVPEGGLCWLGQEGPAEEDQRT